MKNNLIYSFFALTLFTFSFSNDWKMIFGDYNSVSTWNSEITNSSIKSEDFHPENHPRDRKEPAVLQLYQDSIFLFGGRFYSSMRGNVYLTDLWEYNSILKQWKFRKGIASNENVSPSLFASISLGEWSTSAFPVGRAGSLLFNSNYKQTFFLLFGVVYPFSFTSELWEFNAQTNYWRKIRSSSYYGKRRIDYNATNSDLDGSEWDSFNQPSSRVLSTKWQLSNDLNSNTLGFLSKNTVFFFGGFGMDDKISQNTHLHDLWAYRPEDNAFRYIPLLNATTNGGTGNFYNISNQYHSTNLPPGRYGAISWFGNSENEMYLFGGRSKFLQDSVDLQDLWVFSLNSTQWKWIFPNDRSRYNVFNKTLSLNGTESEIKTDLPNLPSIRSGAYVWKRYQKAFIFGGDFLWTYNNETGSFQEIFFLSDLWEFDLVSSQFNCISNCKDEGRIDNPEPLKLNPSGRSYGAPFGDEEGNLLLFSGYFAPIDVWKWDDPQYIKKCRNVSIGSKFSCSQHGTCENDICTCIGSGEYYGDDCQNWNCFGIDKNNQSVCGGKGSCFDHNSCECNSEYSGTECDIFSCKWIPYTSSSVCYGKGVCEDLNKCNCTTQHYYGDYCEEKIVSAELKSYDTLKIEYVVTESVIGDNSYYISNCDDLITNNEILGINYKCYWMKEGDTTTHLHVSLGSDHALLGGGIIKIHPLSSSNPEYSIDLYVSPIPEEFNYESLFVVFFFVAVTIISTLIIIVCIILVVLVIKNITLYIDLRNRNRRVEQMRAKPFTP